MIGEWDYFDDHNVGGDHAIEIERTRKMDGHSEVNTLCTVRKVNFLCVVGHI